VLDLVITGGTVVDGTGKAAFVADVAVKDGRIVDVRPGIETEAAERIDAAGCTVTPGFVDVHTHYDGQVTWDDLLEPSSSHGVTTVAAGNCGVGFAPVRPGQEGWLVQLMEGVEDIPGTSLHEGITWAWESFPQYLDALSSKHWSMDVATMVPHGPVRAYVMGERGAANEAATAEDIEFMARLVRESMEAGAFGFSTSRTIGHKAKDGRPVPGTFAAYDELLAIGQAVKAAGGGLLEFAPGTITMEDMTPLDEIELIGRVAEATGLSTTYLLLQVRWDPQGWRRQLLGVTTGDVVPGGMGWGVRR
jgi:N-acyl-D-amino-acid deacylase